MEERKRRGRNFSVIVVAEGAKEKGKDPIFRTSSTGSMHLGGIADEVARQIHVRTGQETRVTVLGHIQRGGAPSTVDRILATAFGVHAVELASKRQYGRVVGYLAGKVGDVAYDNLEEGTRCLSLDDSFLKAAEAIGISLGR
jgi:6-phosphofructokinase 1